jgi:hypothetical protein
MLSCRAATDGVGIKESLTITVNSKMPFTLCLPEIVPSLLKLRPGGSEPPTTLHVYGGVPPLADRVAM